MPVCHGRLCSDLRRRRHHRRHHRQYHLDSPAVRHRGLQDTGDRRRHVSLTRAATSVPPISVISALAYSAGGVRHGQHYWQYHVGIQVPVAFSAQDSFPRARSASLTRAATSVPQSRMASLPCPAGGGVTVNTNGNITSTTGVNGIQCPGTPRATSSVTHQGGTVTGTDSRGEVPSAASTTR